MSNTVFVCGIIWIMDSFGVLKASESEELLLFMIVAILIDVGKYMVWRKNLKD